jgi:hypothetical protein
VGCTTGSREEVPGERKLWREVTMMIIIILFSTNPIHTCYGYYKTESYHRFWDLPKLLFTSGCHFRLFWVILDLFLSPSSFKFLLYEYLQSKGGWSVKLTTHLYGTKVNSAWHFVSISHTRSYYVVLNRWNIVTFMRQRQLTLAGCEARRDVPV